MPPTLTDEMSLAIDAVRLASRVCRQVRQRLVSPETIQKKDKSPVTVADFASQAVVCARLGEGEPVVGEEDASELRQPEQAALLSVVAEQVNATLGETADASAILDWIDRGGTDPASLRRYWTLDPIDGTKGFLRGEQYAVALALIERGEVVAGVLGCPNLPGPDGEPGRLFFARRGEGAGELSIDDRSAEARAVRVDRLTDPSAARFCESVESGHSDQDRSVRIARRLGIDAAPVRMDSQCKYAAVARGEASIYLRLPTRAGYEEKIWDHAAGMILVQEAGGHVTDIEGRALDFSAGRTLSNNRGVVATSGRIHDRVIDALENEP